MVDQTNREIEIMYKLDHPHIIKLYSHFEDDEDFCLVMQYASKGQLYSIIKRLKRLDQKTAAQYMREIISAVKYLHTRHPPIIHRDIKPENILLDPNGRCKLADFGWSNFDDGRKNRETYCGTPEYLAPEMVNKSGHDESVDIWALGVLLFEMLAGRTPFNFSGDRIQLYNSIKTIRIVWTDDFPPLAKDLISKILRLNPKDRLSLDQIISHQWFLSIPEIRPVLREINYTEMQKLQSHLIQSIPETENKNGIIKSNKQIAPVTRIISNNENPIKEANIVSEMKKMNNNIMNNSYMYNGNNNNQSQIISKDYNVNLPNHNLLISSQNIISSQQNQIRVDKNQYEKEQKELKVLREEATLKDNKIAELKRALDKSRNDLTNMKIKNQEQESMYKELSEKTNILMKCENENKLLKIDSQKYTKDYQTLRTKYDELFNKHEELKEKYKNSESKYKTLETSKNEEIRELEKKLAEFEDNYINNEASALSKYNNMDNMSNASSNISRISQLTKNKMDELFSLINNKFPQLEQRIMENEKKEIEDRRKINANLDYKINIIFKDFNMVKEQFRSKENILLQKQIADLNMEIEKYKKRIEKLNKVKDGQNIPGDSNDDYNKDKQIMELKNIIDDMEQRIQIVEENKNITEEKFKYQQTLTNSLNEKIEEIKLTKNTYKNFFFASEEQFNKYVKDKNLRELVYFNNFVDPDDIKNK